MRMVAWSGGGNLRPHPTYGDLMTFNEFRDQCLAHNFIDYDGTGHWATAEAMSDEHIIPSQICDGATPPEGMTHVMWFNR